MHSCAHNTHEAGDIASLRLKVLLNFEVSKSTEDTFPVANSTQRIIQQATLTEYVKQMCAEIDVLYYE